MTTRILRIPETVHLTGYCDMQLRRMERAGTFPKRFKLNPDGGTYGAVGHDSAEVQEWIADRIERGKAQAETASAEAKEIHAARKAEAAVA